MATLTQIRNTIAKATKETTPRIGVFVGATDGIGRETLTALVRTGFLLKAYIVGRSKTTHEPLLEELRSLNYSAELIYLEGQISLMSETKRIADDIASREKEIDLLFLSAGFLPYTGHQETSEGLDLAYAVAYYSRSIFISRLLPQLRSAAHSNVAGYFPRVVNVLGAGRETTTLFLDDLNLSKPGRYNVPTYAGHCGSMTAVTLNRFAEDAQNQNIVF